MSDNFVKVFVRYQLKYEDFQYSNYDSYVDAQRTYYETRVKKEAYNNFYDWFNFWCLSEEDWYEWREKIKEAEHELSL